MKALFRALSLALPVLVFVLLSGLVHGNTEQHMIVLLDRGPALPAAWKYSLWPADNDNRLGFAFAKSDYTLLSDYSITRDDTRPEAWWDFSAGHCLVRMQRVVVLDKTNGGEGTITIEIQIMPSNRYWKHYFASQEGGTSDVKMAVWGGDYGVSIGEAVLLHDRPFPFPSGATWTGSNSASLSFMKANIMITLGASNGVGENIVDLASAMAAQIDVQEQARIDAQRPLAPTATLDFAQDVANFPEHALEGINLPLSFSVSGVYGTERRKGFVGKKHADIQLGDIPGWLRWEEPAQPTVTFGNMVFGAAIDDLSNPTSLKVTPSARNSEHIAGIIVWGDNLVPTVAVDNYSVTSP